MALWKEFGFALLSRTVLGLWVCLLLPKKWGWVVNSWAETCLQELQQHFLNFAVNIRLLFIALLFRWSCSLPSYLTRPKPSIFPCIFCSLTLPFNVLLFGVFQLATALFLSASCLSLCCFVLSSTENSVTGRKTCSEAVSATGMFYSTRT